MASGSTSRRRGDDQQSESGPADIAFLSRLVRELEDQLRRLGSMNDALEHDLAQERRRNSELQIAVEKLEKRISAAGDSRPDSQALLESISRASSERSDLAIRNRLLEQRLRDLSGAHGTQQRQSRQLREELGETELELRSVELQFSRAVARVEAVQLQVKTATSERDRLEDAVRAAEERVAVVREERNALLAEIADSREALHRLERTLAGRF